MNRPLIGISSHADRSSHQSSAVMGYTCNVRYPQAIVAHGGTPILIPPGQADESIFQLVQVLDGLLLPGGADVSPEHYGEGPHEHLGQVDGELDALELPLARAAYEDDLPILGICRGIQTLAVGIGGTLYQDLPSDVECLPHRVHEHGREHPAHDICIAEGSRLLRIMGNQTLKVNSLHHQAVKTLPDELTAVAWAPDGVIEAAEAPGRSFVLAVQCHPEEMWDRTLSDFSRLFDAFIAAARERKDGKRRR